MFSHMVYALGIGSTCIGIRAFLTLLRSQKRLRLLVFWDLNPHRPPYNKYVTGNKIRNDLHPPGSEKTPENRSKVNVSLWYWIVWNVRTEAPYWHHNCPQGMARDDDPLWCVHVHCPSPKENHQIFKASKGSFSPPTHETIPNDKKGPGGTFRTPQSIMGFSMASPDSKSEPTRVPKMPPGRAIFWSLKGWALFPRQREAQTSK